MKSAEGLEEEGRAALAHNRAVPTTACGMAEEDSGPMRAVVAANGCAYVLNMRDIASMRVLDPEGQRCTMPKCEPWSRARKIHAVYGISDCRRRKAKSQKFVQKEGANDAPRGSGRSSLLERRQERRLETEQRLCKICCFCDFVF
jgi:hypothetical protein